jgi:4a-hydroxytetrahydrobiopterin dehydratase
MHNLRDRKCSNNPELAPKLSSDEAIALLPSINNDWRLNSDAQTITRKVAFKNYYQTMAFANSVAWIAHQNDHHPDMTITYRHCQLCFTTHSVDGLSINDFICAADVDALLA